MKPAHLCGINKQVCTTRARVVRIDSHKVVYLRLHTHTHTSKTNTHNVQLCACAHHLVDCPRVERVWTGTM